LVLRCRVLNCDAHLIIELEKSTSDEVLQFDTTLQEQANKFVFVMYEHVHHSVIQVEFVFIERSVLRGGLHLTRTELLHIHKRLQGATIMHEITQTIAALLLSTITDLCCPGYLGLLNSNDRLLKRHFN